jgi:hypothetical protein
MALRRPPQRGDSGSQWVVFLVGVAIVFGLYYIGRGFADFVRAGGRGIAEATRGAEIVNSATAERLSTLNITFTPSITPTPGPSCTPFVVSVTSARVRQQPAPDAPILGAYDFGTEICVLRKVGEWYEIDNNARTRRLELAYMNETVLEARNPTATPTLTFTPPPTVTDAPTPTPSDTPRPRPTETANPRATPTPSDTPTVTPSPPFDSA